MSLRKKWVNPVKDVYIILLYIFCQVPSQHDITSLGKNKCRTGRYNLKGSTKYCIYYFILAAISSCTLNLKPPPPTPEIKIMLISIMWLDNAMLDSYILFNFAFEGWTQQQYKASAFSPFVMSRFSAVSRRRSPGSVRPSISFLSLTQWDWLKRQNW